MNKKIAYFIIGLLFCAGIGIVASLPVPNFPTLPPTFPYSLPLMPLEQSPNQIFLANCSYQLPIELQDVKIYDINGTLLNPLVTAQIRVWTGGRVSSCSFKHTYSLFPVITAQDLLNNFTQAMNQDLIAQANANTQPLQEPTPLSSTPPITPPNPDVNMPNGGTGV